MVRKRHAANGATLIGMRLALTLPLLGLAACGDACCQKAVDNSGPLSPKPLPEFKLSVRVSPKAAEQLQKHKSRVLVSVLPIKVADKGETPDWWSWVTMGPERSVLVDETGQVTFSGMKLKARFLGNGGYDKIIANVNVITKPYVSDVECDMFDAPVRELRNHRRTIECRLTEARRIGDALAAPSSK